MEENADNELSLQIIQMIEKNEDMWKCKVCGKTATKYSYIKNHAERHVAGMCYSCKKCDKTFPNRLCLSSHITNIHSELFSCEICEKSGMKRMAFYDHKRRQHKTKTLSVSNKK